MKKFALLLIPLLLPLSGCNFDNEITQLTYGTLIDNSTIQLSSGDFETRVANQENFLMAIYPEGTSCSCWINFERVLDQVVKNEHYTIYKFYAQDVRDNTTMQKLTGFYAYNDRPTFYIVGNGKLLKAYDYNDSNPFYKEYDYFIKEINKRTRAPKLMKVDETKLQEVKKGNGLIYYLRSACSDCGYATPNVVVPYIKNHAVNDYIYYFDMQPLYGTDDYQPFKDNELLSNKINKELGFDNGVVPTFQYYKDGALYDMAVYLNDGQLTYNKDDDGYYATNTYYQGERLNKFHYLDKVENKDLSKIKFSKDDVSSFFDNYYLKRDVAVQYHNVYLNAFFDNYLK